MPRTKLQDHHSEMAADTATQKPEPESKSGDPGLSVRRSRCLRTTNCRTCSSLSRRELLEFTLRSDIPVDVLLCNASDYDRWVDSGYDPEIAFSVHLEAEDVLAYTLRFTAHLPGEYAVLLMNWTECPADLAIEIPDWLEPALR